MYNTLRLVPRIAHLRSFHSPFVVLNAANHLSSPPLSAATPIYEKQHDTSPEPHLSSSGTRTYVVSEPDPSDTPYQVPSGAYPASASYLTDTHIPEGLHSSSTASLHSCNARVLHKEAGVGQSAGVRNAAAPGESGRTAGGIGRADAPSPKPGKF